MLLKLRFHVLVMADVSKSFFGDGKDMIEGLAFRCGEVIESETLGVYTEATQGFVILLVRFLVVFFFV